MRNSGALLGMGLGPADRRGGREPDREGRLGRSGERPRCRAIPRGGEPARVAREGRLGRPGERRRRRAIPRGGEPARVASESRAVVRLPRRPPPGGLAPARSPPARPSRGCGRRSAESSRKIAARRDARRAGDRRDARRAARAAWARSPRWRPPCRSPIARAASFPPTANWSPTSSATRRLTILQLGDSHTAADFFTGRVRERLQQVFGSGGDGLHRARQAAPRRALGAVRKRRFRRLELRGAAKVGRKRAASTFPGFNAVARHAGAALSLRARGGLAYDRLEVAFLKQPGGGRAEVLVDGEPSGQIDLNGAADERATLDVHASRRRARQASTTFRCARSATRR